MRCRDWKAVTILQGLLLVFSAAPAMAQGSVSDALSFLLTNQAVPTGDFTKDSQSAAVTRDTITRLLAVELTTQPLSSSSGGFTYRFNPSLGTVERASNSFGPFFTERSLTAGRGRASLGVSLQYSEYTKLDSYTLNDGTFVTTAGQFRDESEPFDVESLKLSLKTTTFNILGNIGLTDRIDVGVAGSNTAQSLVVRDPLPADLAYVAASLAVSPLPPGQQADDDFAPAGSDDTGFDGSSNTVVVTLGDVVGGGAPVVISFNATIR